MKVRLFYFILMSGIISGTMGQCTLELTFTAVDSADYVQLDSIKIMNRTKGGDTVLYWPDTVLSIYFSGIPEISNGNNSFKVFQNYPNPVAEQTTVSLYMPVKDKVSIIVTDLLGQMIIICERILDRGVHSFKFTPGNGNLYFFTAKWQKQNSTIKILPSRFHSNATATIEYSGKEDSSPELKALYNNQDFSFRPGDELLYIGYADDLKSGIPDSLTENNTNIFQFVTNIPCLGTPTVEYEGQVYNTIQIFSQCWLKENLNVGTMITGNHIQTNNGIMEKYCYDNNPDSCTKYGGLYQWNEMMQYTTQQGAQGICPQGWHLPTDEEWKVLEGMVDSHYGIGDPEWDLYWQLRGYDAGMNLKTTNGWCGNGNGNDKFGFSGLSGGRYYYGSFISVGDYGYMSTSTEIYSYLTWDRVISCYSPTTGREGIEKDIGYSVRCLRDY